jgi:leucyl-tRNA synthetase
MLAPMAPHIGEELWRELGHDKSVHLEAWPAYDPALARDELVRVVVQINGKVRDRLQVPAGATEEANTALALASESVQRHLDGKPPRKIIYVPDKLLSIVA